MKPGYVAAGVGTLLVGMVLWSLVNPGRSASAQGGPRRFEYSCVPTLEKPWKPEGAIKLNALGAQGWEMVQQLPSNPDVFCFKRVLPY
jgi:hypothetical protein